MNAPLFHLVHEIRERIENFDARAAIPDFKDRLLRERPDAFEDLRGGLEGEDAQRASTRMAEIALSEIKRIPELAGTLTSELMEGREPPALLLTHALSLAYLVQPRDLLNDDLPGGYGYLDDAIMLWASVGARDVFVTGDEDNIERIAATILRLCMCLPTGVREKFEPALRENVFLIQVMSMIPPIFIGGMINNAINNPLEIRMDGGHKPAGFPGAAPWGRPTSTAGGDLFSLPGGGTGYSGDGMVCYNFDGGDVIALG